MNNISAFILFSLFIVGTSDKMEIYNTKLATSDLQWDKYSNLPNAGWEEVSSYDEGHKSTIRSYQVCNVELDNVDNWIRTPYIEAKGGKEIYLQVEFSVTRCGMSLDKETNSCKETFNMFYYEADSNVASSTFPPWQEKPYKKVDTVAANYANGLNKKIFAFGPVERNGFYIAFQDQGACMSVIALKAYYFYCPEVVENLVAYPRTVSEPGVASLVTVNGDCTKGAVLSGTEVPRYRCSSDGKWQIATGKCLCDSGFQENAIKTRCVACPSGTFKLKPGSDECAPCPENSGNFTLLSKADRSNANSKVHNQCPCFPGYARAAEEEISVPCTGPPSSPTSLVVASCNSTSVQLRWSAPENKGGREEIFYKFKCEVSSTLKRILEWKICPSNVDFIAPSSDQKFFDEFVEVVQLMSNTKYRISIYACNNAFQSIEEQNIERRVATVIIKTNQSVPFIVSNVQAKRLTPTKISVSWSKPIHSEGQILNYEVCLISEDDKNSNSNDAIFSCPSTVDRTSRNSIVINDVLKNIGYQVIIRAKTSAGFGAYSKPVVIKSSVVAPKSSPSNTVIIIMGIICVLFFSLVVLFIFRYKKTGKVLCLRTQQRRKRCYNNKEQNHPVDGSSPQDHLLQEHLIVDLPPPGQRLYVDYSNPQEAIVQLGCEIEPETVKTEELIGTGEFAEVYRGKLTTTGSEVAVKKLKEGASTIDQNNFLREASTMAQFKHPNVIQLKGAVTKQEPVMIVTEFMTNKSLDVFLQKNQGKLTVVQLVEMLKGIASGMKYLASMKYIHRDLAARNILVDSKLICKVSDFGLSRTIENDPHATYTTQGGKIAIRWTALECILYRKFTSASDVWSYGIVIWEVMSYGEKPYWDMNNEDVIKNVQSGMRLPSPQGCPKVLHDMMLSCWSADPNLRPTFAEITEKLDSLLRQPMRLLPDVAQQASLPYAQPQSTMSNSISSNISGEEVISVERWLEMQKLSEYSTQFKKRGIDNLEKVCNLTINDLKSMGINVTLHINKLECEIQTLRRHLSTNAPSPCSSVHSSPTSNREQKGNSTATNQENVFT